MKEWILSGFLIPGKKIDQDDAAERLGLSRMPIRSALDRLAADGLTIVTPHHGAIVTPLSDVKLNDLFDTRCVIESMAVIQATQKASNQALDKLYSLVLYQQNFSDNSTINILEQNKQFHRYIALLSENESILQIFDTIWEQCERYRRIYYRTPHSNDRIVKEHLQIVNLMVSRNPQAAADFIVEHTRMSQKRLLEDIGSPLRPLPYHIVCNDPPAGSSLSSIGSNVTGRIETSSTNPTL